MRPWEAVQSVPRRQSSDHAAISAILRALRERAGLSRRELAGRLGLGHSTVAAIESGADVRLSTLARYLEVLPEARARDFFPGARARRHIAPIAARAWRTWCRLFGFSVGGATLRLRLLAPGRWSRDLLLEDIRPWRGDPGDLELGVELARTVFAGSAQAAAELITTEAMQRGSRLRLRDGDVTHELVPGGRRSGRDMAYRQSSVVTGRRAARWDELGAELLVDLPMAQLTLEVRGGRVPSGPPALAAWPVSGGAEERNHLSELHEDPGSVVVEVRGTLVRARVERPVPGFIYGLRPAPEAGEQVPAVRTRCAAGRAVARARAEAGLSLRDAGLRMGTSWVTVRAMEEGKDPRHSTAAAALQALPLLAPSQLLDEAEPLPHAELWEFQCEHFGFVADLLEKRVVIPKRGPSSVVISTRGLRSLRDPQGALTLRIGAQRLLLGDLPPLLRQIGADVRDMRTRVVERRWRQAIHQFVFPHGTRGGVSYTRRYDRATTYLLTARRARERGVSGPFVEGASIVVQHPARQLRLEVRFPRGHDVAGVSWRAWPARVLSSTAPDVLELPPATGHSGARLARERDQLVLSLARPLVGVRYGLLWTVGG